MQKTLLKTISIILVAACCALAFVLGGCVTKQPTPPQQGGQTEIVEPQDDRTPTELSGIENVRRMAYRLQNSEAYAVEGSGTVQTKVLFVSYVQNVWTYKSFKGGVMVEQSIAKSSLVNTATQTCYVGDRVLWRNAASSSPNDWDGLATKWAEAEPQNYSAEEYKLSYGLLGTDFSVYVLNEQTVTQWTDVTENADGTFTQTVYPDTEKAGVYYTCRMKTMGGLSDYPCFNSIALTYTFDKDWNVLKCVTEEDYSIDLGIIHADGCTAVTTQTYSYAESDVDVSAFDSFFSDYVDLPSTVDITDGIQHEKTASDYLFKGFADLLTSPVWLRAEVTVGENTFDVCARINIIKQTLYANVGDIDVDVWYKDEFIYAAYGKNTAYLQKDDAIALFEQRFGKINLDLEAIMSQLADGKLTVDDDSATLESELTLGNIILPLTFRFDIDGDDVTLNRAEVAQAQILDYDVSATLRYENSDRTVPAIPSDSENFVDLKPVLDNADDIVDIAKAQRFAFGGNVKAEVGGTEVAIAIESGAVDLATQNLYIQATLACNGVNHQFALSKQGELYRLAYGQVGVELKAEQFAEVKSNFEALYNRIQKVATDILPQQSEKMPSFEELDELLLQLDGIPQLLELLDNLKEFDVEDVLKEIVVTPFPQGLLRVSYNNFAATVFGDLTAEIVCNLQSPSVNATLEVSSAEEVPALAEGKYLTSNDLASILDCVGTAAEMLTQNSVTLGVSATVRSTEDKYSEFDGIRYNVSALLEYNSGGSFPISVDVDNKTFSINAEMYVHATVSVAATSPDDDSIYFDVYITDANSDGTQDGILDLYLSVSKYAADGAKYNPLKFYAPATEITSLISAAAAMLNINGEFFDVLAENTIGVTTALQLRAVGDSVIRTLGFGTIADKLGGITDIPSALRDFVDSFLSDGNVTASDYVKAIDVTTAEGQTQLIVTLNSSAIYGADFDDVTFGVVSAEGEQTAYVSFFTLNNVRKNASATAEVVDIMLTASLQCEASPVAISGYYDATGVSGLVAAVANSATYEEVVQTDDGEQTNYALLRNFYIDGGATAKILGLYNIKIDVIAVSLSVDEQGELAADVYVEYQGVQELGIVSINGDTKVNMSFRNGMVYIKRTQTSKWEKSLLITREVTLDAPIVIYRVMPVENFLDNIVDHIPFLFNLSDFLAGQISGASGGRTDDPEADYGTAAANYLKSYGYSGNTWQIVLNGDYLTDGVLGDLTVKIVSSDGALSKLDVSGSVFGLIDLSLNMKLENARNVMAEGVTDVTADVSGIADQWADALEAVDWAQTSYIEGQEVTIPVTYVADGVEVGTDEITYVDTKANRPLNKLTLPEIIEKVGYTANGWGTITVKPTAKKLTVNAQYLPNTYAVFAQSEKSLEGIGNFEYDEAAGLWKTIYTYDTVLTLPIGQTADNDFAVAAFLLDGAEVTEITNITESVTLAVEWRQIEYTLTYISDGETFATQTYHLNDAVVAPQETPQKQGYSFAGWNLEEETITGNGVATATFEANNYIVTVVSRYDIEGLVRNDEGNYVWTYLYDSGVLQLPVNVVYSVGDVDNILQHYATEEGEELTQIENILANVTLHAVWAERITYTVTFTDEDGETVSLLKVKSGDRLSELQLPDAPQKAGYTAAWNIAEDVVTDNLTVAVRYTPIVLSVTLVSQVATGLGDVAQWTVEQDLPAASADGYTFLGWFTEQTDGEEISNDYLFEHLLDDGVTAYAHWQINYYTVTIKTTNATVSGVTSGSSHAFGEELSFKVTFSENSSQTVTVTANGKKLTSGTSAGSYKFTMPAGNVTITASSQSCVVTGTLVTLADGSQKKIEELDGTETLLAWDFVTGSFVQSPISLLFYHGDDDYTVTRLTFEDGTMVGIIGSHAFFDCDLNRFVYLNSENCMQYVGHNFAQAAVDGNVAECKFVRLVKAEVTTEHTGSYSVQTAVSNNFMAEGMFSVTPPAAEGAYDYFEIGANMTYDSEKMQADIAQYGLYTYEEWSDLITYEQFVAFNGAYLKVLVGKGVLTEEGIADMIAYYLGEGKSNV